MSKLFSSEIEAWAFALLLLVIGLVWLLLLGGCTVPLK